MNFPSSRRSSSISSAASTPISRRRNSNRNLNTTCENPSANSPTTTRTLRRLQSKSKTVKWTQPINSDKINDESSSDESPMDSDRSVNEMTPSTIINSLSISHPKNNNDI
ncbi:unnamed protein product [Rotaria magnacalcarata]|uniref:Uncharacterized protein n=1 Tax=Rotaria magnacalcarata TaxID=392030 RepID=A0A814P476_9BILA|nr:unnamed protein product [Rotaria magnacalcarata]CAF2103564.1 unnamed protein product [Rotaria magnacalcarata]CAF2108134.1 unnamed protein product [Rotaria magnacalcarata]CAF3895862.1 unnamed protein product [Rotaria magnacalcarata]CAF4108075.1 unnamed protein product [Rotaria magnacalcarata]